ncbi:hypothetical protein D3C77_636560 [compost metagenome]
MDNAVEQHFCDALNSGAVEVFRIKLARSIRQVPCERTVSFDASVAFQLGYENQHPDRVAIIQAGIVAVRYGNKAQLDTAPVFLA